MKVFKFLLLIVSVGLIGFGVYHSLFKTELTLIKEVSITGAQPATEKRLHQACQFALHQSFWKLDVSKVAAAIKSDSWIEDAEVSKIFPDKISVKITERAPHAILNKGGNQFVFLDEKNNAFGPVPQENLSEKVVLSGKNLNEDLKLRARALDLIKYFPDSGPLSVNDLSEMQYATEKGFEIILTKSGMKIDLGKENIPLHIDRARRVVQYLDQHQINATHVDADYAKKVLVKVRKDR